MREPSNESILAATLAMQPGARTPFRAARDAMRHERATGRLAVKAREILQPYGATLETVSGDPRGYCLKFRLASGESMGG